MLLLLCHFDLRKVYGLDYRRLIQPNPALSI